MKTIGIVGQVDHDNYGDILIVAMYVDWVNEVFKNKPVLYGASNIFVFRLNQLGCEFENTTSKNDFLKRVDVCVFAGGGYLGRPDYSDFFWQIRWLKNPVFYDLARLLRDSNIPYFIEGAEIGPGLYPFVFWQAKYIVENAKSVATRNQGSYRYLISRFRQSQAVYIPDVVLCAEQMGYFSQATSIENRTVDLAIHATGKVLANNQLSVRYRKIILEFILDNNFSRVMLVNDQPYNSDRKCQLDAFSERLRDAGVEVFSPEYDGVDSVVSNISTARMLITSKLHLGVTAMLLGLKVACIASHPKLKRYYRDINATSCYCDFYLSSSKAKRNVLNSALGFSLNKAHFAGLVEKASGYKSRIFLLRDYE